MNAKRPAEARREETPGRRCSERSADIGCDDLGDLRWELRGRLHACLAELGPSTGVDWDAVQTILEGAVEDIEAAT
jgi:hypothetical protein